MDGARFSETWGDNSHEYIPNLSKIFSQKGVINTDFYNQGLTNTNPGHAAVTTGHYENLDNSGKEYPSYPSFFQFWNEQKINNGESWIITSKDKLEVLKDCKDLSYKNFFWPNVDCGIDGLGSGYRHDSITFKTVMKVLSENHPNLILVNFREPDFTAHKGDWNGYLEGIKLVDGYISLIDEFIENDPLYMGKTALFVTNDHGRHLDSVSVGFSSHGDDCLGCRHINFFAKGPDFKAGSVVNQERGLIDINATLVEILQIDNHGYNTGDVMWEIFK